MRTLGIYLMVFGALSFGLYFLHMNSILLIWMDNWGINTGWLIRGGLVLLGAILWFIGKKTKEA